jgi:hypothetical protein
MKSLTEIIDALEKCTGPDRALDAAIFWLVDRAVAERYYWNAATGLPKELPDVLPERGLGPLMVRRNAPRYTGNFDDAMRLLPAAHEAIMRTHETPDGRAYASVKPIGGKCRGAGRHARHKSLAIAICIAALGAQLKLDETTARAKRQAEAVPA